MKNIDYAAMGGRIRNARLNAGLSQSELAEKCNLSISFLNKNRLSSNSFVIFS